MFHTSALRRLLILSAAIAPLACAGAAAAQSTEAKPAEASTAVKEIVVTAGRREENLSKVALSVSAFTAAKMDVKGIKSFGELARYTPGVTFDPVRKDISIRGISSQAGAGTTGVYIDDTPIQMRALGLDANNTLPAVFDLDRVEVERGPQGTLFGAGSEGGTVRYITRQPSLTSFSALAHSEVATTQDGGPSYEAGVAMGGPIVQDKLGFRISGWARRDGGFIDRVDYQTLAPTDKNANRTDTYVGRAALTLAPIDALKITAAINYQDRKQHDYDQYWVSISDPGRGVYRSGTPDRMADKDRFWLPSVKVEWDFGPVTFISNTSYLHRKEFVNGYSGSLYNLSYFQQLTGSFVDPMGNDCAQCLTGPDPLLTATGLNLPGFGPYSSTSTVTNEQKNFAQEFRLQSSDPDARLTWVAGVFLGYNTQRSIEEINDPQLPELTQYLWGESMMDAWGEELLPNGDDYINNTKGHDRQIALFADGAFKITDQLKVTAGIRYAWTHFDFVNAADGAQNFGPSGGTGKQDETPVTPKVGVSYQADPDNLFYATVAKGYRIGGANPPFPQAACQADLDALGITSVPASFNSDTVMSYEIGSKNRLMDRRISLATSAYYVKWSNIQQANYLTSCGFQYTANLGTAESKGFDFQGEFQVTEALDLELAVGYTDARYSKTTHSGSDPTSPILVNKGDTLGGSPWSVTVGAQYNFPAFSHDAFIRADYEFSSHNNWLTAQTDPATANPDLALVNDPATNFFSLRSGITVGHLDVAVFMDNVFNSHPQLGLTHQDQYTLLFEASTLRPRTIGLSGTYRY